MAPVVAQDDAQLLYEGSGGVIDVQNENRILVEGIEGTVHTRVGKPGEVRFECRSLTNRREERAVSLWVEGRRFVIRPPEGSVAERLLLEIAIPPLLDVEVHLANSRLQANGLRRSLSVRGRESTVDAHGIGGAVDVKLVGGALTVDGAQQDVTVETEQVEVKLSNIGGFLTASFTGGSARLNTLADGADLTVDQTQLITDTVEGHVVIRATGGAVGLYRTSQGAELEMSESPLTLSETKGAIVIETDDAAVEFRNHTGAIRLDGYGGSLRGSGVTGPLEVNVSEMEITLEKLGGVSTIQGDGLKVHAQEVKGSLTIQTGASTIVVQGIEAELVVQNDFGDVFVSGAVKDVTIETRDGNVRVSEQAGPLELKANGPEVVVGWSGMSPEKNSVVQNEGGSVSLSFFAKARCRVQAESKFGRVQSELADVRVSEDEQHASGILGRGSRPMIQAVATGDVLIGYAEGTPQR